MSGYLGGIDKEGALGFTYIPPKTEDRWAVWDCVA